MKHLSFQNRRVIIIFCYMVGGIFSFLSPKCSKTNHFKEEAGHIPQSRHTFLIINADQTTIKQEAEVLGNNYMQIHLGPKKYRRFFLEGSCLVIHHSTLRLSGAYIEISMRHITRCSFTRHSVILLSFFFLQKSSFQHLQF